MATIIANCKITGSLPGAEMQHLGYDDAGNAILRKANYSHMPGDFFEMDEGEELLRLLTMDAVRYPSEMEAALHEIAAVKQEPN